MGNGASSAALGPAYRQLQKEQTAEMLKLVPGKADQRGAFVFPEATERLYVYVQKPDEREVYTILQETGQPADAVIQRRWLGSPQLMLSHFPLIFFAIKKRSEEVAHILVGRGCKESLSRFFRVECFNITELLKETQLVCMADLAAFVGEKAVLDRLLKCPEMVISANTLGYAAYMGNASVILALKDRIEFINQPVPMAQTSALGVAAGRGHLAAVNVLLKLGAAADYSLLPDRDESDSPLFQTALGPQRWWNRDVFEESGIEPSTKGGINSMFLRVARLMGIDETDLQQKGMPSRTSYRKVMRALVQTGANIDVSGIVDGEKIHLLKASCLKQNLPALLELALVWPSDKPLPEAEEALLRLLEARGPVGPPLSSSYSPETPEELEEAVAYEQSLLGERLSEIAGTPARNLYDRAYELMQQQIKAQAMASTS
jgi:hypothetical protein